MFIENDIFKSKDFIIDVINKKTHINNYKTEIKISTRPQNEFIKRNVHIKSTTLISFHFNMILIIKIIALSINRDFLFEPFI